MSRVETDEPESSPDAVTLCVGSSLLMPVAVLLLLPMTNGCAARQPAQTEMSLPANIARAEESRPPAGTSGQTWAAFVDVASTCRSWASVAERESVKLQKQLKVAGILSAVAGTLALAGGVTTGVLASREEDSDKAAEVARIGGITTSGFGLIASGGGIYAGTRSKPLKRASLVSRDIHAAVSTHTIAALSAPDVSEHEQRTRDASVQLAVECAVHARRLNALRELPLGATASARSQALAELLRNTRPGTETRVKEEVRCLLFQSGQRPQAFDSRPSSSVATRQCGRGEPATD